MKRRVVISALAASGCWNLATLRPAADYTSWERLTRTPGYRVPAKIPLVVARRKPPSMADDGGYADSLTLAVQAELRKRGIESELVDAHGDAGPLPRVELSFVGWERGNGSERYVTLPTSGHAAVVVEVRALSSDNRVMLEGRVAGEPLDDDGSVRKAAQAAGSELARVLAEASYDPLPKSSPDDPP